MQIGNISLQLADSRGRSFQQARPLDLSGALVNSNGVNACIERKELEDRKNDDDLLYRCTTSRSADGQRCLSAGSREWPFETGTFSPQAETISGIASDTTRPNRASRVPGGTIASGRALPELIPDQLFLILWTEGVAAHALVRVRGDRVPIRGNPNFCAPLAEGARREAACTTMCQPPLCRQAMPVACSLALAQSVSSAPVPLAGGEGRDQLRRPFRWESR